MTVRTIGEVLDALKGEFEDVTISKIRFLEGEGLIRPQRTASGYRQFTDPDVDRLRYILRAQRDRYLPLKVIKQELDRLDETGEYGAPPPPDPGQPDVAVAAEPHRQRSVEPPLDDDDGEEVSLTQLAADTGLDPQVLRSLQDHGLLSSGNSFTSDDRGIAAAAAQLIALGLEARHLRMYRQFADREAALYEQLVTPMLRQRDPEARAAAIGSLDRLRRSGGAIYRHLVAQRLRSLVQ